jgi:hypothetical protein
LKLFRELEHKRGVARVLDCFACLEAGDLHAERALRLAGAAAALRGNIGAPLAVREQGRLEASLAKARTMLSNSAGTTAWLEGWAMPIDGLIEEMLADRNDGR